MTTVVITTKIMMITPGTSTTITQATITMITQATTTDTGIMTTLPI